MNYNGFNNYEKMEDKNKYIYQKDLITISNLSNSAPNVQVTSTESKIHNSPLLKIESDQVTNKNTNESILSPNLKNTASIPPYQQPIIDPSMVPITNSNHIIKTPFGLQPELSAKPSTTTQLQYYETVKSEANVDRTPVQNFSNNKTNGIPNISMIPNTGIKNTNFSYMGFTPFPTTANGFTEAYPDSTTTRVMNITQPGQLSTQQPLLLSTPTILQLQSPMHLLQPVIAYSQRQPQNQYLTSMSLPIQSTTTHSLQQDSVIPKPWKPQNLNTIPNVNNNNNRVSPIISQLNTFKIVKTNPLDPIISKEVKDDSIQVAKKESSTSFENNNALQLPLVPSHISNTTASTASTTDTDTGQSDTVVSEKENGPMMKMATEATNNNLNLTTKETVEEKESNTNENKSPVNESFNMEEKNTLGLNKKKSKRLRDSRRAIQNRNAQKAFRQRKEKYVKLLELKVREYDEVMQENIILRKELSNLKNIIFHMEQQIQMYNGQYMNDLQHRQQQLQQLPRIPQLSHQFQSPPPPPPPPAPPL